MFAKDRQNAIMEILIEDRQINVSRLSTQFGVSEVTIRKDLENLENAGLLIRTHGGAVIRDSAEENLSFGSASEIERCPVISRIAASLINDDELVYLGSDTVCTAIATLLLDRKRLSVITNNLSAAQTLSGSSSTKTIIPGGLVYNDDNICFTAGTDTIRSLEQFHYDKMIISIDAANLSSGLAMRNAELRDLYQIVLKRNTKKIFCISGDAFERNAMFRLCELNTPDIVISDERIPEPFIECFYKNRIKVFTSYDLEKIE